MTKDKYDLAIEYLIKNPSEIEDAWRLNNEGKALFNYIGNPDEDRRCGCLTQIKNPDFNALAFINGRVDWDLIDEIKKDSRLPISFRDITVESLPVFAEWQRKIDKLNEK